MNKVWQRKGNYNNRVIKTHYHIRNRILIVCEGKKTEPNYFNKFPVDTKIVKLDISGDGANTVSLVRSAIDLGEKAASTGKPYNQIWCVFDRDSFPAGNFNHAFRKAQENHIKIAYSNQCFELWYLLHYCFYDTAINRSAYRRKLSKEMGEKYKKNDIGMYERLRNRQKDAIQRARKLRERYNPCNPEKDDPCTTVDELVETLNEYISS